MMPASVLQISNTISRLTFYSAHGESKINNVIGMMFIEGY
jgi:hypothetical protein